MEWWQDREFIKALLHLVLLIATWIIFYLFTPDWG